MDTKKKNNRYMSKICPECGGRVNLFEQSDFRGGVKYSEKIIECLECGWTESLVNKRDRRKKDLE